MEKCLPDFLFFEMRHPQSGTEEFRIQAEKSIKYRGSARVNLDNLYFASNWQRELSRKNVERLKGIFRVEGVRRLELGYHVPAVVDKADLDACKEASDVSTEQLMSNSDHNLPFLNFPAQYRLICLHGRHRIQAAREILPQVEAWWTVDFYLSGTLRFVQLFQDHPQELNRL